MYLFVKTFVIRAKTDWFSTIKIQLNMLVSYKVDPGLTTLAKNRETWLLPQRTWGRSEDMTGRHVFSKMWVFSLFLHLKCVFVNILFISFIFNIKFMLCICFIIIIDLIFIDFRFIHVCLEICQWHLNVRFLPPIIYVPMIAVFKT
jgi:hypothetical protein